MHLTTGKFYANFGLRSERYNVEKEFARGGMGRVLVARDKAVGRDVALKELLPEMISGATVGGISTGPDGSPKETLDSQGIVERFLREAKITGQLEHPNIVPVYEIGKDDGGDYFYTMRFVRGKTLAERLREIRKDNSFDSSERFAARIKLLDSFVDICNAIAYAHSRGVIHRDIKPENVMLGDFGETLVLDWGLARVKGQRDRNLEDFKRGTIEMSKSLFDADSEALTMDGSVVGTPAYMAPEQARGELEDVDHQSDVYALGAVLYQILTGYPPYEGPMAALIVQQVLNGPPLAASARDEQIPPELESLINRAMARDKSDRLNSALELASEVKAFRDGRTLGSYSYSTHELLVRFFKQNRTAVGISTLCFLLLIVAGIYSYQQIVEEKNLAENAHELAQERQSDAEYALKIAQENRLEKESAEKKKFLADKANYDEKAKSAPELLSTIENLQISSAIVQLNERLADLDRQYALRPDGGFMPLPIQEQQDDKLLLERLNHYVLTKSRLLGLFTTPPGVSPTPDLDALDRDTLQEEVSRLRIGMSRLAKYGADFDFARQVLALEDPRLPTVSKTFAEISAYRTEALSFQSSRFYQLMQQIDDGLNVDYVEGFGKVDQWGPAPALVLPIVEELQLYQNLQALGLLVQALDPLIERQKATKALSRVEIDKVVIVARVLGQSSYSTEAVKTLKELLLCTPYVRIQEEATAALVETGNPSALTALIDAYKRLGRQFFLENRQAFTHLPMPARLREPVTAADYLNRSVVELAFERLDEAADMARRAVNLNQTWIVPLIVRAEVFIASGNIGLALQDAEAAVGLDENHYNAALLLAEVLQLQLSSRAFNAFDKAAALAPEREDAYVQKARAYVMTSERYSAIPTLLEGISLCKLPYRSYMLLEKLLAIKAILKIDGKVKGETTAPEVLEKAISIDPGYYKPYSETTWNCRRGVGGGFGEGTRAGAHATLLNPDDNGTYGQLAEIYFGRNMLIECEEAGLKYPDSSLATYYAAIAIRQKISKNDYLMYQRMWRKNSIRPHSFAKISRRNIGKSVELLIASSRIDPDDLRVLWILAQTQLALRKFEDARSTLQKAFEVSPASSSAFIQGAMPSMRIWQKALLNLDLLGTDLESGVQEGMDTQRRRMQKIQLLAVLTEDIDQNARKHIFVNPDVEPWIRESIRLLELVRKDYDSFDKVDQLEFIFTEELLISALTPSHIETYPDALIELNLARVEHNRYVTDDAWAGLIEAYQIAAAQYSADYAVVLGKDEADQYEKTSQFWELSDVERNQKRDEFIELAYQAWERAIEQGAVVARVDMRAIGFNAGVARFDELAARMSKNQGLPENPSNWEATLTAWAVQENHPAWAAGIREGDQIVSVDGRAFDSASALSAYLRTKTAKDSMTIKIRRHLIDDGDFVPLLTDSGAPVTDEIGRVKLEYEEITVTMNGGYVGFIPADGVIPLWKK
ncbi:MAG: serine/threonine-protein kinase [Planctomycetota bacterium]